MRFQVDHDWQGHIATPRTLVGEGTKTRLLLLLCVIWVVSGLIAHAPWKPLESLAMSSVQSILQGSWSLPIASGENTLMTPPLYYWSAALSAQLFSPLLDLHDGARLANVFWLSICLLMVGMTGREMWARGVGRYATFIFIGTIGLVVAAHSLTTEIASLTGLAIGFYALCLTKRRPWRAAALLGVAWGVAFLSGGGACRGDFARHLRCIVRL